jgi:hypothetical protein
MCQHYHLHWLHSVSNTHPVADAHTLSHAFSDAFSDANPNPNTNPNTNSHTDTHPHANANTHTNTDSNSKAITGSKPQAGGQPVHLRHSGI